MKLKRARGNCKTYESRILVMYVRENASMWLNAYCIRRNTFFICENFRFLFLGVIVIETLIQEIELRNAAFNRLLDIRT